MLRSLQNVVLLVAILFYAGRAFAGDSNCSTIPDLSADLGPNYNQGEDINSCFAMVSADQLTKKMQNEGKLKKPARIQPLALWALYTLDDGRLPNRSQAVVSTPTNVFSSLESLRKSGNKMLCTESDFGSEADSAHPLFEQAARAPYGVFREQVKLPVPPALVDEQSCASSRVSENQVKKFFWDVQRAPFMQWWNSIKGRCHLAIPKLENHRRWIEPRYNSLAANQVWPWPRGDNEKLAADIDQALRSGNLPAVEYQASFLLANGQPYMHWSSIVAREMRGGRCYYKIRNSYGSDCERYKDKKNCVAGNIWVEKNELLNHADAVSYLK